MAARHPTLYWTGDAGDDGWDDPGNWSYDDPLVSNVPESVLPDAFDNVVIDLSNQTINLAAGNYDLISSLTVTGQDVTLNLSSDTLDLSGVGAALGVSSVVGGQGTFQVDQSGDVVDLQGTDLKSAAITSGTILTVAGGALDNVQLDGTLDMTHQSGASLQVVDAVTINGTVELGGSSNSASLDFGYKNDASGMTVAGSGTIQFGQSGRDSLDNLSTGTLTLGSKITIEGGHNSSILDLYPGSGPIDNKGTIEQNTAGGQLTINLPGWVNDGSIEVSNGGTATLKGKGWTNSATGRITATDATLNLYGSWTNHGTITIDPSTLGLGSPINVSPSDPSVPDYAWSNQGTLSIGAGSTVNLGSVLTTDDLNALIASGLIPPGSNLYLTGVLDNSPADNPTSGGILALEYLDRLLVSGRRHHLPGDRHHQRQQRPRLHGRGWNTGRRDARRHAGHDSVLWRHRRRGRQPHAQRLDRTGRGSLIRPISRSAATTTTLPKQSTARASSSSGRTTTT